MTLNEKIHVFENSRLVSEQFTQEAVTASYVEALAALRAQQAAERKECYIVVHRNYADGTDAYAFQTEEKAEASIRQDVDAVTAELEEQGYSPRCLLNPLGGEASVYVPDSDIYYEWQAVPSHVE